MESNLDSASAVPPPPPPKGGEYELANKSEPAIAGISGAAIAGDESSDEENEVNTGEGRPHSSTLDKIFDLTRLSIVVEDVKRGNVWKLCYDITCWYWFWILVTVLILAEPCLVSWNPYLFPNVVIISSSVMTASSVCLAIQLAGRAYNLTDDVFEKEAQKSKIMDNLQEDGTPKLADKIWITFRKLIFSGSFVLEGGCLFIGWAFLFYRPGMATLRCFRAFRILWYHELPPEVLEPFKHFLGIAFTPFGGRRFVDLFFKVMKFATVSLSHLGQEMIFLTKKSRGGFILMVLLFYTAYVLGTTLWIETSDSKLDNEFCATLGSCTYTMLRLTFFDGNGFDFAYSLVKKHPILFGLCCLYLCVTSFGLVNGLIGVFGDIFKDDSDRVFETNKEVELISQKKENEHFKRYNNTAESLVLVQMKLEALDKRFERLEALLKANAKK